MQQGAGRHFFLAADNLIPVNNGSILTVAQIINAVMTSTSEARLGALYINVCDAIHIWKILKGMGHHF